MLENSVVLIASLLAQVRSQTRERAAHALARRRFVHPARRPQLAKAQLALEAEDDRLALARLQLRERRPRPHRALPLQRQIARVARAPGVVHQPEPLLPPGLDLGVTTADAPRDPEEPRAHAA